MNTEFKRGRPDLPHTRSECNKKRSSTLTALKADSKRQQPIRGLLWQVSNQSCPVVPAPVELWWNYNVNPNQLQIQILAFGCYGDESTETWASSVTIETRFFHLNLNLNLNLIGSDSCCLFDFAFHTEVSVSIKWSECNKKLSSTLTALKADSKRQQPIRGLLWKISNQISSVFPAPVELWRNYTVNQNQLQSQILASGYYGDEKTLHGCGQWMGRNTSKCKTCKKTDISCFHQGALGS